jgi:DNA processing protein
LDRKAVADRVARLRLARTTGIGPVTYRQLVAGFGSAAAALEALPDLARRGDRHLRIATRSEAEDEIAAVERFGGTHLFVGLAPYPELLAGIEDAPPVLTVRGRVELAGRPMVGIVGARNASASAVRFASDLAAELCAGGLTIVSGLARGIDTAAHMASLQRATVAVVAGGADVVYPPENARLQARIGEQGLVVAEQRLGSRPQARHFPRRNRIIAGLSTGTVVVEAALRSGSLITARQAADYGREVMAVPGSPLDPRAAGANLLIREGATLVQSAGDVFEALGLEETTRPAATATLQASSAARPVHRKRGRSPLFGRPGALPTKAVTGAEDGPAASSSEPGTGEEERTIALLSPTPITVDELVRQSGLAPAAVHCALLSLELSGRLLRHAGGKVALAG